MVLGAQDLSTDSMMARRCQAAHHWGGAAGGEKSLNKDPKAKCAFSALSSPYKALPGAPLIPGPSFPFNLDPWRPFKSDLAVAVKGAKPSLHLTTPPFVLQTPSLPREMLVEGLRPDDTGVFSQQLRDLLS